jgi:hypothetical protein
MVEVLVVRKALESDGSSSAGGASVLAVEHLGERTGRQGSAIGDLRLGSRGGGRRHDLSRWELYEREKNTGRG